MNIGCDLDGVIIDHSHNQARMLAERGFIIPREEISKQKLKTLLAPEEYTSFKKELYDMRAVSAQQITGALNAIQTIASLGHEIRIISRRDMSSAQALEWLDTNGFLSLISPSRIHFVTTYAQKEDVCRLHRVELHIDDSPEVFEFLRTPRHRILFDPFGHHQADKQKFIISGRIPRSSAARYSASPERAKRAEEITPTVSSDFRTHIPSGILRKQSLRASVIFKRASEMQTSSFAFPNERRKKVIFISVRSWQDTLHSLQRLDY